MLSRVADNFRVQSRKCGRILVRCCSAEGSDGKLASFMSTSQDDGKNQSNDNEHTTFRASPIVWSSVAGLFLFSKVSSDKDKEKSKLLIDLKKLNHFFEQHDLTDFIDILISKEASIMPHLSSYLLMQGPDAFSPKIHLSSSRETSSKQVNSVSSFDSSSSSDSSTSRAEELHEELLRQQMRYQKEIEKLEKENRELKKSLLHKNITGKNNKHIQRSLIDMYSEILDTVSDFESNFRQHDEGKLAFQLPRVVVIGDQSSGKTSVLEMIVQARIFPRGSGEMMTRSPVQVTLNEGPYHIARLRDDSREYNLNQESDLELLRSEIERRMKNSIKEGQTISNEVISLTVTGPGLQRMVLVDLPGVISTVTSEMATDTKERIKEMCQQYMSNKNAIILCVQDGSLDAERSIVTDLVNSADPKGKRSIFVLTKVDLAESKLTNPDRIRQILEGKLFPMQALGYFAVVTGRGNSSDSINAIKEYEQTFFNTSNLFKDGILSAHQMGTMNLCMAVSQCFWQMVRESVEQQAADFEARRFNLEAEWKNLFPKFREMDREELFEKAKNDILDKVVDLSQIPARQWDDAISKNLWNEISNYVFENIYLPAAQSKNPGYFNTAVDIKLKDWAEKLLCRKSLEIGQETLEQEFNNLMTSSSSSSSYPQDDNDVFDCLRKEVLTEVKKRRRWDAEAENNLKVFQRNVLEDRSMPSKQQWDEAIGFMKTSLQEKKKEGHTTMEKMLGPSFWQKYFLWRSRSEEQSDRRVVKEELEKMFGMGANHGLKLNSDELIAIRKNLEARNVQAENIFIEETWQLLYQQQFLERALLTANDCVKGFFYYQNGIQDDTVDCSEVILFWRINRLLKSISKDIRRLIMSCETQRLEKDIKDILDKIGEDEDNLKKLLKGRRVELAEEIKNTRVILKLLEEFIQEFNKNKA